MRVTELPKIYPPRPRGAIHPSTVGRYRGYLAQYKVNDIRVLIAIMADGEVAIQSRKREPVRSFRLDATFRREFAKLRTRKGAPYLLDGGIFRADFGRERRPIVLWDLLVDAGDYLLGSTYRERYDRLRKLAGNPSRLERITGYACGFVIAPELWLARNFTENFAARFEKTRAMDEVEGLVLKNPRGRLQWGIAEENNGDWNIRVRKANARHLI